MAMHLGKLLSSCGESISGVEQKSKDQLEDCGNSLKEKRLGVDGGPRACMVGLFAMNAVCSYSCLLTV